MPACWSGSKWLKGFSDRGENQTVHPVGVQQIDGFPLDRG